MCFERKINDPFSRWALFLNLKLTSQSNDRKLYIFQGHCQLGIAIMFLTRPESPRFPGVVPPTPNKNITDSAKSGADTDHSPANMAAGVQAALQALQAGNQLSAQLQVALQAPWQNQLAALAMKQAAAAGVATNAHFMF